MVGIALYQPDIPQNAGTVIRTAACFGVAVHLVHPAGFTLSDRHLRRAGMDYLDRTIVTEHRDWAAFVAWRSARGHRLIALSARAVDALFDFRFAAGDLLLLGRESAGLPDAVLDGAEARLRIPIRAETRSLNVAAASAIAMAEALRQIGAFPAADHPA